MSAERAPRRSLLPFALAALGLAWAGCGGDAGGSTLPTAAEEPAAITTTTTAPVTTTTTLPEPGPQGGATYVGSLEGQANLSGTVVIAVAESGEEIAELTVNLDMDDYECDGGTTMSGGMGLGITGPVPIVDGSFEVDSGTGWRGEFESALLATGSVHGSLPLIGGQTCDWGPFPWTAEPGTAPAAAPEPEATLLPIESGTPFAVGDLQVELVSASFEPPSSGGFVLEPEGIGPDDVPLTLEFQVLSGGDAQSLSEIDKWIVDGEGHRYPVAMGLVGSDGGLTVTFALPGSGSSLELLFETEESFDLTYVLGDLPGGGEPGSGPDPVTPEVGEYAEFCAVNQRLLERAEESEDRSPEARAAFWQMQMEDSYLLVDLVPDDLRADMEIYADTQSRFVDLLKSYDYDMTALLDDVGIDAIDAIFTQEVSAAVGRVDEFTVAVCPQVPDPTG